MDHSDDFIAFHRKMSKFRVALSSLFHNVCEQSRKKNYDKARSQIAVIRDNIMQRLDSIEREINKLEERNG